MELFEETISRVKALFSCRFLKTGLFENDDVTVSKTETASALSNETDTSGRTKAIQTRHVGTENFWKTEKKTFVFSNENGYVWTGPDSINLDAIKRWRCTETRNFHLATLEVSRISWAHDAPLSLTLDWLMKPAINSYFPLNSWLVSLRCISLHVFRISSYVIFVPSSLNLSLKPLQKLFIFECEIMN